MNTDHLPAPKSANSANGCGRIFLTLFLGVFAAMGTIFLVMLAREIPGELAIHGWTKTPATITQSRVGEDGKNFRAIIRYRYEADGRAFEGNRIEKKDEVHEEYSSASKFIHRYPSGSATHCFVNPQDPTDAILEKPKLGKFVFILLPLVFMVIGYGGIIGVWFFPDKTPFANGADRGPKSVIKTDSSAGCGALFGFVFLAAGLGMFWFMTLRPIGLWLSAQTWEPVPCTVVSSKVIEDSGGDSTTYKAYILYRYEYRGERYQNDRYDCSIGGSSSGYKNKKRIVAAHSPGSQHTCYVNPKSPYESTLNRKWTGMLWLGLFPLPFIGVGAAVMWASLFSRQQPTIPGVSRFPSSAARAADANLRDEIGDIPSPVDSPVILKPTASRFAKLVGIAFFALFWNGITFAVFGTILQDKRSTFIIIFASVFVLVGLGLLWGVFHQMLCLANPSIIVRASRSTVPLGGSVDLEWSWKGMTNRLQSLKIWLEGREEATYTRGTDSITDKHTFARIELIDTLDRTEIEAGKVSVRIPARTMHTFQAKYNKILWILHVDAPIAAWPNVNEEFPIDVSPAIIEPKASGKLDGGRKTFPDSATGASRKVEETMDEGGAQPS